MSVKATKIETNMFLLVFLILNLATIVSTYVTCPNCGEMEVPYPLSTSPNCGDSNYRIYCNNNILQFSSSQGFYYKILSIDPTSYKLIISPPMIKPYSCYTWDIDVGGLVLDENLPFNISTRNTVMLFNCSADILKSPLNCSSTSLCRRFEEEEEGGRGSCRGTLCCHFLKDASMTSHRIKVRIGGCTAYTSVVSLNSHLPFDEWNYGVELQWLPPN